jgi:hypothetical protein
MIDKDTRLESTFTGPGRIWTFVFTIIPPESKKLNQAGLQAYLGPRVTKGFCTLPQTRIFLEQDVTVILRYNRNDGVKIGDITVKPSDCKH